jgi:hypothetical protein
MQNAKVCGNGAAVHHKGKAAARIESGHALAGFFEI